MLNFDPNESVHRSQIANIGGGFKNMKSQAK
jgi:hypothetical protein